jgi:hypothetical protein
MKLYIPEIGDRLKLTSDWTFSLQHEYRNRAFLEYLGFEYTYKYGLERFETITIPSGSVLKVDRIYIRKGAQEFSSITFYYEKPGTGKGASGKAKKSKSLRFWAKLSDCNKIEFEIEEQIDTSKLPLNFSYVPDFPKHSLKYTIGDPEKDGKYIPRNNQECEIMIGQKRHSSKIAYRVNVTFTEIAIRFRLKK